MTFPSLPTPCLLVDLDDLDYNLGLMAGYFADRPAKLRPHFKSHKCVELARRQLAAGNAVGITCAKLSEAEQLVAGGVTDVLIANQLADLDKARRLAELNRGATVRVAIDAPEQVALLGRATREAGVTIGVLVEVDIGMGRCGVAPGEPALALARQAVEAGLRLDGLQAYEGHLICNPDPAERRATTEAAFEDAIATRRLLEARGLPVGILSGGGTGTYDITGDIAGIDEIQAGSYALMDCFYTTIRPEFRNARCVLATVVSATPGKAVADVGVKGLGNEFGLPVIVGHPDAKVRYVAEEHTVIDGLDARVGERIRILPSHGCTTNNLYRRMHVIQGGEVVATWAIEAANCLE